MLPVSFDDLPMEVVHLIFEHFNAGLSSAEAEAHSSDCITLQLLSKRTQEAARFWSWRDFHYWIPTTPAEPTEGNVINASDRPSDVDSAQRQLYRLTCLNHCSRGIRNLAIQVDQTPRGPDLTTEIAHFLTCTRKLTTLNMWTGRLHFPSLLPHLPFSLVELSVIGHEQDCLLDGTLFTRLAGHCLQKLRLHKVAFDEWETYGSPLRLKQFNLELHRNPDFAVWEDGGDPVVRADRLEVNYWQDDDFDPMEPPWRNALLRISHTSLDLRLHNVLLGQGLRVHLADAKRLERLTLSNCDWNAYDILDMLPPSLTHLCLTPLSTADSNTPMTNAFHQLLLIWLEHDDWLPGLKSLTYPPIAERQLKLIHEDLEPHTDELVSRIFRLYQEREMAVRESASQLSKIQAACLRRGVRLNVEKSVMIVS